MANNKERIKQLEKVCRLQYGMSSVVDKLRHMEESINKLSEVLLTTEVGSTVRVTIMANSVATRKTSRRYERKSIDVLIQDSQTSVEFL